MIKIKISKVMHAFALPFTAIMVLGSCPSWAEQSDQSAPELNEFRLETLPPIDFTSLDSSSLLPQPLSQTQLIPVPSLPLPRHKSPFLAVGLSGLFPGLGHVYLDDMKTATGLMGSAGLGLGISAIPGVNQDFQSINLRTLQATSFYGIYAAYRDVRLNNGQTGYSYKMPTDSFTELTSAPFSWSVIKKPEVWGGVLGSLAIATTVSYFVFTHQSNQSAAAINAPWLPLVALPVGVGEESFFRGFLLPQFSEWFSPMGGLIASSLVFGAMHIPNALALPVEDRFNYYTTSIPLITAFGAYCGWLTQKNRSLKQSVAVHTWYDFTLFAVGAWANHAMIRGRSDFSMSIPF